MFALLALVGLSVATHFVMKGAENQVDKIAFEMLVLPELLKEKEKGEGQEE